MIFSKYPDTNFHELNLDWVIKSINELITEWTSTKAEWNDTKEEFEALKKFINDYFSNLDVTQEINDKLDKMVDDGTIGRLLQIYLAGDASPVVVSSTSAMTDKNKLYVLTSNGHVYYYVTDHFIDSGINYGVGENVVKAFGAVNSENYVTLGIRKVTDFPLNSIYLVGSTITKDMISDLPFYGFSYTIHTVGNIFNTSSTASRMYFVYSGGSGRTVLCASYSPSNDTLAPWITLSSGDYLSSDRITLTANNHTTYGINSVFDIAPNKVYALNSDITSDHISDLPDYGAPSTIVRITPNAITTSTGYSIYIYANVYHTYMTFSDSNRHIYTWKEITGSSSKVWTVGDGAMFKTIQGACGSAKDGDTILVYPGTYEEQVTVTTKNLHIVGVDRDSCIVVDHSGNYSTPPFELRGGSLKNLTIIEDASAPTYGSSERRAYCVHYDFDFNAGQELIIDNCKMYNSVHACVGVGAWAGMSFKMINCELHQTGFSAQTPLRGAFYMHTGERASAGRCKLYLHNNVIESSENIGMTLQSVTNTNVPINAEIHNNIISASESTDSSIIVTEVGQPFVYSVAISKTVRNFGNNISSLN